MPTELHIHAVHDGGMRILTSNGEHSVLCDYPLKPDERAAGLRPMELLLASLGACGGSVVALMLERMKQPLKGLEVDVRGQRRDEHPTIFTSISMEFTVHGPDVDPAKVAEVIAQSEAKLCPVWAMIKPGTPITTTFKVTD